MDREMKLNLEVTCMDNLVCIFLRLVFILTCVCVCATYVCVPHVCVHIEA